MTLGTGAHAEEIARGLARRISEVRKAEDQLSAFTWDGRDGGGDVSAQAGDSRLLLLRALHVASESGLYEVLSHLGHHGDIKLNALVERLSLPRLAVVDRVSALAQAGLASRELESDRVGATQLGRGIVAMMDNIAELVEQEVNE